MNMFLTVFVTALLISLACTPLAIHLAPKIGAVDIPKDERRMHTKPVPRFGGLAIYLGTMISILIFLPINGQLWGVVISGTLMYLVGVYDDIKGMPPRIKFLAQIICACILYQFSIKITGMTNPFPFGDYLIRFPWALSIVITVLWIVGITNTINLIDGLDGLAAGISMIACLSIAYTAFLHNRMETCMVMLAIAGGALGFLPYNFNPAKIFMGDGGSLFLGFMLASVSITGDTPLKSTTVIATIVPMFVLALPIFDTAFAILRRMANKRPIMEADKGHLHHRIMAVGLGQKRTVLTLYSISGIMGVAAILMSIDVEELRFMDRCSLWVEAVALVVIAATLIFVFLDNHKILARQQEAINQAIIELERQAERQAPEEGAGPAGTEAGGEAGEAQGEAAGKAEAAQCETAERAEAAQCEAAERAEAAQGETARSERNESAAGGKDKAAQGENAE